MKLDHSKKKNSLFLSLFLLFCLESFAFHSNFVGSNAEYIRVLPSLHKSINRFPTLSSSQESNAEESVASKSTKKTFGLGKATFSGLLSILTFTLGPAIPVAIKEARSGAPAGQAIASAVKQQTSASASMLKKFTKRSLEEKLANVPVFVVTNAGGQPYLVPTADGNGDQMSAGLFFFDPEDAETMVLEMLQSSGELPDARIFAMNLEKAISMAFAPPRGASEGQRIGFQFFPNAEQLKHCGIYAFPEEAKQARDEALQKKRLNKDKPEPVQVRKGNVKNNEIPVFYVPGLTVRKDRTNVKPLFFSVEDAKEMWNLTKKKDKENLMPETLNIQALNLFDVIIDMQVKPDEWKEYGFIPMKKAMEFVKTVKRKGSSSARLHKKLR